MTNNLTDHTSLWREAWAACKRNGSALLPWVLGFSALLTLCNFYIVRDEMQTTQTALSALQGDMNFENLSSVLTGYVEPPVVRVANICADIISFIGFYYFTVLYLKREPLTPNAQRPELSPSSFGNWLGQILKAAACILGATFAVAAVGFVLGWIIHMTMDGATDIVAVFASIAVMLVLIYTTIRFLLVSPLTLSGVGPSLKASWDITKQHWWRLLWGYFCIGWSVFVVFAVAFLVLTVAMFLTTAAPDSVFFVAGLSVLMALYTVVNLAMSCIYFCVACRILMAEKHV